MATLRINFPTNARLARFASTVPYLARFLQPRNESSWNSGIGKSWIARKSLYMDKLLGPMVQKRQLNMFLTTTKSRPHLRTMKALPFNFGGY